MSPRRMLNSCGSSSSEVLRSIRPTGPTRLSCEMFQLVWDSASSSGLSERNFIGSNDTPSRPTRLLPEDHSPTRLHRTARAIAASSGDSRMIASADTATSSTRLIRHDGLRYARTAQPDQRQVADGAILVGDVRHLVQPREDEDLALLSLALAHHGDQLARR